MTGRKKYDKPVLKTEKLFEKTVLTCGKLQQGPSCAHVGKSQS